MGVGSSSSRGKRGERGGNIGEEVVLTPLSLPRESTIHKRSRQLNSEIERGGGMVAAGGLNEVHGLEGVEAAFVGGCEGGEGAEEED